MAAKNTVLSEFAHDSELALLYKLNRTVRNIIGMPYGSVFELQHRSLKMVNEYDIADEVPEVVAGDST